MSENAPAGQAGEQSMQVDLGGGHNGEALFYGTWIPASWLELGTGQPPSAPTGVSAVGRYDSIIVSWVPPPGDVSYYTATAAPGGLSCSTSATSCTIAGLTDDTAYTVTVTAANPAGTSPPSAPVTAVPRDANPDYIGSGHSGLAWLTAGPGKSHTLWLFDGAHGFATAGRTPGWGIPRPGVAGDFTGNGTSEIAWFQPSSPGAATGSIYLVSWDGTTWRSALARGPGVGAPIWAGAGDFTGTGHDDLAWLTAGPGKSHTLWLFDGAHGFATIGKTTGWGVPKPGIVGDFSGNGPSQIAWFQPSSPGAATGNIYLVSWYGTTWRSALARGPGVGAPIWAGAGDFTGTGHDDLAWLTGSTTSSHNTLWLFDGADGFATVGQTPGWGTPQPGVAGDYSGDGTRQIAWFQPASTGASTGSIYLVSWTGTAWDSALARGPGVGTPDFAATTSSSYPAPHH